MDGKSITKRVAYISVLCLLSGFCCFIRSIYFLFTTKIMLVRFVIYRLLNDPVRFPSLLSAIFMIAVGIVFWRAFKSDSSKKAFGMLRVLKIAAPVIMLLPVWSLVQAFVPSLRSVYGLFHLAWFEWWAFLVGDFSAVAALLTIFFSAVALPTGNTKMFNVASAVILILEVIIFSMVTLAVLIASGVMEIILITIVMLFLMLLLLGRVSGTRSKDKGAGKVIKGAIIGAVVAGDVGAVVGAIAASQSNKNK